MAYCDAADVRAAIKADAVDVIIGNECIDDEAEREAKIAPLIEGAIADADGEIDGYLAKRYPVPLTKVPRVIAKFAKDLALYNLFSRVGIDEADREKTYLTRYNAAIAFLKLVADGKVDLGIAGAGAVEQSAKQGFKIKSSKRLFTRDSMRGL